MKKCFMENCEGEGRINHHLIPRWCGGLDGDIVDVCFPHHIKLDRSVETFVKYGSFDVVPWQNIEKRKTKSKLYSKNYKRKTIEKIIETKLAIRLVLQYNIQTNFLSIMPSLVHCMPTINKKRGNTIQVCA